MITPSLSPSALPLFLPPSLPTSLPSYFPSFLPPSFPPTPSSSDPSSVSASHYIYPVFLIISHSSLLVYTPLPPRFRSPLFFYPFSHSHLGAHRFGHGYICTYCLFSSSQFSLTSFSVTSLQFLLSVFFPIISHSFYVSFIAILLAISVFLAFISSPLFAWASICSLGQFYICHFFYMTSPCTPHQFLFETSVHSNYK